MRLFPYIPRGSQAEIVRFVSDTVSAGGTAVMESGTGTGKTICALAGALEGSLEAGMKVVYLTRTKSQQRQVILESRAVSGIRETVCLGVRGRDASTCPYMREDPELATGTPEELSRLCSDLKRKDGCRFFKGTDGTEEHIRYVRREHPEPEEFISYACGMGMCPYELMKSLLPHADVVAAPYSFMAVPGIRRHFLEWMNVGIEDTVVIVDEAHNIPDYLRETMTVRFTEHGLDMTDREADEYSDPEIHDGISVRDLTGAFRECLSEAVSEYLGEEDGLIPPSFLEEGLMSSLGVHSVALDRMYRTLEDLGAMVTERRKEMRRLPRSYMGSLGRFLRTWSSADEEAHVKLITAPPNAGFESYCLDPYEAAEPFRTCGSSIHMSGTLSPTDDYVRMLGLDADIRVFPSPFDPGDLLTVHADDVSTRFDDIAADPGTVDRLESHVLRILAAERRNAAVFFPSYSMMDLFIRDRVPERAGKPVFYERRGADQSELAEEIGRFRRSRDSVLFAVSGGRVSEGLDFPDTDLEIAVLVGIPYPRPTARLDALVRYCDIRYGDGWDRAVRSPTVRRMRQAIGRLIRSETDRGAAVILDRRASAIKELGAKISRDIPGDLNRFFSEGKGTDPPGPP